LTEKEATCPKCGAKVSDDAEKCEACDSVLRQREGVSKEFSQKWDRSLEDDVKEDVKKAEEELAMYDKLIEGDNKLVRAWLGKGSILSRLGRYGESVKCFDRAIKLDERNEEAWRKKLQVMKFAGMTDEAGILEGVIKERFGAARGKARKKETELLLSDLEAIESKLGIPKESTEKLLRELGKSDKKRSSAPSRGTAKRGAKKKIRKTRAKISAKTGELVGTLKAIEGKLEIDPKSAISIWGEIVGAVEERKKLETELEAEKEFEQQAVEHALRSLQDRLDISPDLIMAEIEKERREEEKEEEEDEAEREGEGEGTSDEEGAGKKETAPGPVTAKAGIAEEKPSISPELEREILGKIRGIPKDESKQEFFEKAVLESELEREMKILEKELELIEVSAPEPIAQKEPPHTLKEEIEEVRESLMADEIIIEEILEETASGLQPEKGRTEAGTEIGTPETGDIMEEATEVFEKVLQEIEKEELGKKEDAAALPPVSGMGTGRAARAGKGLTNGLVLKRSMLSQGRLKGQINGTGRLKGLVNGKRRVSGRINGVTGLINGRKGGKINGLVNGRGRINGLINGRKRFRGKVNGTGRLDGYVNGTKVSGVINGLIAGPP
jgi:tetratricopeptide (TPR) repeat protein